MQVIVTCTLKLKKKVDLKLECWSLRTQTVHLNTSLINISVDPAAWPNPSQAGNSTTTLLLFTIWMSFVIFWCFPNQICMHILKKKHRKTKTRVQLNTASAQETRSCSSSTLIRTEWRCLITTSPEDNTTASPGGKRCFCFLQVKDIKRHSTSKPDACHV